MKDEASAQWHCGHALLGAGRVNDRHEVHMTTEIPSDMVPFVQRMVSERRFLSESDVLAEGLRMLQARETLREEVAKGFAQLDAGLGVPADQVYARAEERIAQIEQGE